MSDEEAGVDLSVSSPKVASLEARPPVTPVTDAELLAAAARGDERAAAGLLVSGHAEALGRACMALLGSQAEAQDALQDTLLAALSGLTGYRGDGPLRAWLLSIARRTCAKRLERRSRERDMKQSLSDAQDAPTATAGADRMSLALRARRLLSEIRPSEREALVLRFTAELSFRELGEATGIDEVAARKRVSRGLARLRALLSEEKP